MTDLNTLMGAKLWLAPLAGYTDQAFRQLCRMNGVDVLVSEMVSADGLTREQRQTLRFIRFDPIERPFGIQLFGSDPLVLARAAELCLSVRPDFLDLNMGCPVRKVVKRGAGCALMRNPPLAGTIMREVKAALSGACLLGAKFRSGWNSGALNYLEFGATLEEAGADFLCLHPRTQEQMFGGAADWNQIARLRESISVPLIGNGDIRTPEDALELLSRTGCASVMIGRGALGKPWLFAQIRQLLDSGDYRPATKEQVLAAILSHIDLALKFKPERIVTRELRSQLCFYTKGLVGGAELRQAINHAESTDQIKDLLCSCEAFKL